mmetsp:Transcript_5580/g.8239  ORF Transcript_5580/g.8239 Transcript_5580/m.8239 type:complete len:168 (-) Transcript_5580:136-639(-)
MAAARTAVASCLLLGLGLVVFNSIMAGSSNDLSAPLMATRMHTTVPQRMMAVQRPSFRANCEAAPAEGDSYSPEFVKRVRKALKINEKDWSMEKLTDPKNRIDTLVKFSKKRDFDPEVLKMLLSAFKESGMESAAEVRKEILEYLRFSRVRKRIMDRQLAELFPESS